jgi:type VI secretion system protein ImpF
MPLDDDEHHPLMPSVLDRLLDDEPGQSTEPLWRGSYRLEHLREDVRRDLEALLNTRHARQDLLKARGETAQSTLTYGLPDFTSWIGAGPELQAQLRDELASALQAFEPRLTNVRVIVREPEQQYDRNIRLTIQAVLHVDPVVEAVTFDTVVESLTGNCEIRASS